MLGRKRGLMALATLYLVVGHLLPRPQGVLGEDWRTMAIFVTVIAGMILQPLPSTALVLLGLMGLVANGLPMREVLVGYAEPSVWLVVVAMLIARCLLDTGLARRIALLFTRAVGRSSLGISYALLMSDVVLASGVPSVTARSAGMMLPIVRSLAELFGSKPGETARRLGTALVATMYQGSTVACAMFLTGQASNFLGAKLAAELVGVHITWLSWLQAAIVPGMVSCIVVPWLVHRLLRPEVRQTPEAITFAQSELDKMGPLSNTESITMTVFISVGLLWMTSASHHLDVTYVAMLGLAVLLISGTLSWETVTAESGAWDVFVWYGGLFRMSELLNKTGLTKLFADTVAAHLTGIAPALLLLLVLLIYFYIHYGFASITAHVLALFPPFVVLLVGIGIPSKLAVFSLLCLANLPAGLTHYGTTTGPIVYGAGYVSLRDWWRVGLLVSFANLAIWLTVGFAWWKVLGFW